MKHFLLAIILGLLNVCAVAQDHYVVQQSNTGLRDILYNPLSEQKADELFNVLDLPSNIPEFKVFGTDIAPVLGFSNNSEGYDQAYNIAKNLASSSAPHFLMIFKEKPVSFEGDNNYFNYRIFIKWPATTTYDTLLSVLKESVRKELEVAINISASTNTLYYPGNVIAEGYCIDEFIKKIKLIQAGELEITVGSLLNTGFEEVPIDGITIENTTSVDVVNFDFAGLKVGNEFVRENEIEAKEELESYFTCTSIYTDNDAFTNGNFNSAQYAFTNASTKITIWYHYFESTEGNKLFYKSTNTIILADAISHIDSLFNDFLESLNIETPEDPVPFHGESNSRTSGDTCISFKLWSAYKCALPFAKDLKSMTGGTEFGFGITCGLIDGTYGLLRFIYETKIGLNDLLTHTPLSPLWFIDGLKKVFNKENFKRYGILEGAWQGIKEKLAADRDYFVGLFDDMTFLIDYILTHDIIGQIYTEIIKVFKDITFQNGTKFAGYWAGIAVFEAMLAYLTYGTYQVGRITAGMLTKIKTAFRAGGLKSMLNATRASPHAQSLWTKCQILFQGCFIAGTPVLLAGNANQFSLRNAVPVYVMASMPFISPIQNIQPDDIVKSYHHEQSYYATAGNNNDIYVPGWQSYDYLDITPETWQNGTFEIIETNGDIVNVEANRPKTWYQENNVNAIGDKAHLYMPEIGINGNATLLSIRPTVINTSNFALNESSLSSNHSDGSMVDRPVITTFKRNAPVVFDYYFSDGAVIGATPEHPFFSLDRNAYLAVGELQLGEQVMTAGEKVVKFIAGKQRDKGEAVYNFEVWREHNYYVGSKESGEFMLVHNTCPSTLIRELLENATLRINKINGKLEIPNNWDKKDVLKNGKVVGSRYVHPTNSKIQIRVHEKGVYPHHPHNYDKPYARYELGEDSNGIARHADIDGNMVDLNDPEYYEKTHFLIESLDVD